MDIYLFCFCLGFLGFAAMTLLGLSHAHGDGNHAHASPHGHHSTVNDGGHDHAANHAPHSHPSPKHQESGSSSLWMLLSPRVLFSLMLGFGGAGLLLQETINGPALLATAAVFAWFFERWIVTPIWKFFFGFASAPARTLEHSLLDQAEAVVNFDSRGEGVVAVNLDGQVVQMLGRLERQQRNEGIRVRSGDRLMIVSVDPQRHSCTVTRLRD